MRLRTGVITSVYSKSLRLSNDERTARNSGDIVNLMSVDGTRLQDFCQYGVDLVAGPFQILLAFVSLYKLLGWPSLVGVCIMALLVPLNTCEMFFRSDLRETDVVNRFCGAPQEDASRTNEDSRQTHWADDRDAQQHKEY